MNNSNNNSVWSSSHLIKKIQDNDELQLEDDEILEEQRYELERLKALVPKTISNNRKSKHNKTITNANRNIKNKKALSLASSRPSLTSNRTKSQPSTATSTSPSTAQVSIKEQEHFLYFIKCWTSNSTEEYSYFKSNTNNTIMNIKASNSTSNNSYFFYNPFS